MLLVEVDFELRFKILRNPRGDNWCIIYYVCVLYKFIFASLADGVAVFPGDWVKPPAGNIGPVAVEFASADSVEVGSVSATIRSIRPRTWSGFVSGSTVSTSPYARTSILVSASSSSLSRSVSGKTIRPFESSVGTFLHTVRTEIDSGAAR